MPRVRAQRGRDWVESHVLGALLIVGAMTAAVGAYLVNSSLAGAGSRRRWLLALGGGLTAATILLAAAQQYRTNRRLKTAEEVAVEASEDLTLTLNAALAPITDYLGGMADAADEATRQLIVGQLLQAVVDAAVRLTAPGARSTFYALDPSGASLTRVAYSGRPALPRAEFTLGTPDGNFVLDLVYRGDLIFVDDVDVHPLVTPSAPGYGTVIAVAVTAGDHKLGMLTVDAPTQGDLTSNHVDLVRVLANLLGSGLAQV
jgi:GAF domain